MKKTKKIYGVSGMMEYQAIVKIGKATMKVPFTDGSMTAMGVNPATFTTEDFMTQHAIEHSSDFKRGRIFLHKTIPLEGEVDIRRNPNKPEPTPQNASKSADAEPPVNEIPTEMDETPSKPDEAPKTPADSPTGKEFRKITVACNDDAKDYLEENFGAVRSKLKTRTDIAAVAATHGIEFVYD